MPRTARPFVPLLAAVAAVATLALPGATRAIAQNPVEFDLAPDAHAYALVVGSNAAGPGQEPLEYAERDAERVADVLVELGRYERERVELLRSPGRAELTGALQRLRRRVAVHRVRNEQSVVFFYYSGHAQSQALRLGREEMPLAELRAAIDALPSTLTVVVLDACQSGAYSRVRGAETAADFSQNSVQQLETRGVAVMASSSGDELSQESERLAAGYFTHHLLMALRGAADEDGDGRVGLDEAYRYAYAQTLHDTSRTAVGGQHVTLETSLTGHGAVPLTYPARAGAHLELPADLEATVIVMRSQSRAVMAELTKARGAPLRLALPRGRYEVLVRREGDFRSCSVTLPARGTHVLDPGRCTRVEEDEATVRYAQTVVENPWGIELGFGLQSIGRSTEYTERLVAFGFEDANRLFPNWTVHLAAAVERRITRRASVLLTFDSLESGFYDRGFFDDTGDSFSWNAWALAAQVRGTLPLHGDWLVGYAQAGVGLGIARTEFDPGATQERTRRDADFGVVVLGGLGLRFMPARHFGFHLQANYAFAPILKNDFGDRHDAGGLSFVTGIRVEL